MKSTYGSTAIVTRLHIMYGDVVAVIKEVMEEEKTDLVIMGTNGATGLREMLIGSNTEKVVRYARVPVLSVRTAPGLSTITNILLPTTLQLDQLDFMNKLKALQEFFHASLHLLLVNTPVNFKTDQEAQEAKEAFVEHYGIHNYVFHFVNFHYEEEGIINFASREKMDIIAMATHGRKGLSHVFNGSLTEDVVNHTLTPVWSYCLG